MLSFNSREQQNIPKINFAKKKEAEIQFIILHNFLSFLHFLRICYRWCKDVISSFTLVVPFF